MALQTAHVDVSARERKARCRVVVECRPFPLNGGMADRAVLSEACSWMVGIGSGLKCWTVATDALSACSGKRVTRVALHTGDAYVSARQR